jgi:hypothetical protein
MFMSEIRPTASAGREPFAVQAAKFSLYAPFVIIVLNILLQEGFKADDGSANAALVRSAKFIIGGLSAITFLAGLVLGVVALFGISKHGAAKILWRAIAGICLNGLLLLASLAAVMILSGVIHRLRMPIDHSLTTADYVMKGVPAADHAWMGADYQRGNTALSAISATDANSLPRWKSPASGEIFDRLCPTSNPAASQAEAATRLLQEAAMAVALSPLANTYTAAVRRGANYNEEITELTRWGLRLCVDMDNDMRKILDTIPLSDPRHAAVAAQFDLGRPGLAQAVDGSLSMLNDKTAEAATMARLARYERDLVPPILHALTPERVGYFMEQVRSRTATETDPDLKSALGELLRALQNAPRG